MSDLSIALGDDFVERIAGRVADLLVEQQLAAQQTDRWLNVDQAAEYLAAPKSRVYDLVGQGALSPGRDGRRLVFRRADLDTYLLNGGAS